MDLNTSNIKKIKGLILFAAAVCLVVMNFEVVLEGGILGLEIIKPFAVGAAIAFVLNIPMSAVEKRLLAGIKNQRGEKLKRPLSILLALIAVVLVVVLVVMNVIPQITKTMLDLGNKIPKFLVNVQGYLEEMFVSQPQLLAVLNEFDPAKIDWKSIVNGTIGFMKSGLSSVLTSTVSVASGIINGVVNIFISLIFSIYILAQKEKLGNQTKRLLHAYLPPKTYGSILKIASLMSRNFGNFITGQCTEAVILGAMFVIAMSIFGFPYAVMVGVLIAFTALIPIVGAFIGCFIGAFLIMVDDPMKAVWFLVLFVVLQQLEGNLIYPHVVGNSVGLPSIWVLAAVTVGGSLMGVGGMLIFIPIISTVYSLVREDVNKKNSLKQKEEKGKK
ncbi:AI-2E family transporter [Dysosmobacter sp.]|uniref:AI-2E family transporter n=1 Tax=Dysosmobacter sp. TaxID=2591382 RepID=UPI002A8B6622|nr:AI-2E family transporter [Dysosmobacter sp.]MDY3985319.1 AI-2E family transporter [Dysosmobacter sp.]